MIGLINVWDYTATSYKYILPYAFLKNNTDNESVDAKWAKASIKWGLTVLDHEGYLTFSYRSFEYSENIFYTISYFSSQESIDALMAKKEHNDFVSARDAYINATGVVHKELIVTMPDNRQFDTVEELIEFMNTNSLS